MVLVHGHLDIVQNRHVFEQADILKGPGDPQAVNLIGFFADDALPLKADGPFGRGIHTGEQIEHRRLSRAVRADEATISFSSIRMYTSSRAFRPPKVMPRSLVSSTVMVKPPLSALFRTGGSGQSAGISEPGRGMEISYRPSRPVGLNSMTRIRITEYTSIRYWLKSRSISGSRVSTEAEITDPVMEPSPPARP